MFQCVSASRLHNVYLVLHCKIDPRRKYVISGYTWHRSFIQTAKCSLLDEKIVYQCYYGVPLMFSYFLLWGKVLCFGTCQRDLRDDYCPRPLRRPCRKHYGCVPLGWSGSRSVIQDLSESWCIKGTGESALVMDSPVPLMHHDPDRSWITDLDPDHPKGTHPHISSYIWHKSFTQTVKCSISNQIIVYQVSVVRYSH